MAAVGAPDGGDAAGVARGGQPVVDRGADLAPLDRRLAGPMMAGDQQHHAVAARDRLLERRGRSRARPCPGSCPCRSRTRSGSTAPAAQPPVPGPVQRPLGDRHRLRRRACGGGLALQALAANGRFALQLQPPLERSASRAQRPDRRRDPRPQLRFFRAERAHGRRRPWAPGSAPGRSPTCRRRSPPPPARRPRRCRSGWGP